MLQLSGRIEQARQTTAEDPRARALLNEAEERLLAGQCNDAYWHGVFGGLYAPHLRSALLRNLIRAESLLDKLADPKADRARFRVTREDFDADGRDEMLVEHSCYSMCAHPADGGTVSSLRFKPCDVELINSLMRRPEAYHDALRQAARSGQTAHEGPASIHEIMKSKGSHLEAMLRYDRYERRGFRSYIFPIHRQWQNFQSLELGEVEELASGAWEALTGSREPWILELRRRVNLGDHGLEWPIEARKSLSVQTANHNWQLECRSSIAAEAACPEPVALGLELVFNLLAPNAPDRYFAAHGVRRPLAFSGEIESDKLEIVDEWQRVRITLTGQPHCRWWLAPIETVSQSESGFESVYQGSAILAVWRIDPAPWREFTSSLRVDIARI
jgi:alpha-amylase